MITLSVDHPDIFDFIRVKQNASSVKYANISVRVTDEFMKAVVEAGDFTLRFGNGVVRTMERTIRARELWNELIKSAKPGLMFWDTIKNNSPSEYNGMEVITTNPLRAASAGLRGMRPGCPEPARLRARAVHGQRKDGLGVAGEGGALLHKVP